MGGSCKSKPNSKLVPRPVTPAQVAAAFQPVTPTESGARAPHTFCVKAEPRPEFARIGKLAVTLKRTRKHLIKRRDNAEAAFGADSRLYRRLSHKVESLSKQLTKSMDRQQR